MTDEERNRIIQMIFVEIRADHTPDGLKVEFRVEKERLRTARTTSV
jgi:hypothetical protein